MPKVIENIREQIIEETRRQIAAVGYSGLTIRSVATACHIAVGTVYNYFPSKEVLVAAGILEDWNRCLESMKTGTDGVGDMLCAIEVIYTDLTDFIRSHTPLFTAPAARKLYSVTNRDYHPILRKQISSLIADRCGEGMTADFIAEAMLCWVVEEVDFADLRPIFEKIIQ